MDNQCQWCENEFEENDAVVEYRGFLYCDEECLAHDIGARTIVYSSQK